VSKDSITKHPAVISPGRLCIFAKIDSFEVSVPEMPENI
jgi:hypothetical protein